MDVLAIALFGSFGAWWAIAPESVARFYKRLDRYSPFHRGLAWEPKPVFVRIIGVLWIALVVSVFLFAKRP